jgi:hypothetical protein
VNLADHTLKVATLGALVGFVAAEYETARQEAKAAYRANGVKGQVAITLPNGEEVGDVIIKKGTVSVKLDEPALLEWAETNTPTEVEEYLDPSTLLDQEAIEWAREHRDDLLKRRVRGLWLKEKVKEATANDGCVIAHTGEATKVAEVTTHPAMGDFALSPDSRGVRADRILTELWAGRLPGIVALPGALAIAAPAGGMDPAERQAREDEKYDALLSATDPEDHADYGRDMDED